jgi:hypothetical protein
MHVKEQAQLNLPRGLTDVVLMELQRHPKRPRVVVLAAAATAAIAIETTKTRTAPRLQPKACNSRSPLTAGWRNPQGLLLPGMLGSLGVAVAASEQGS